MPLPDGDTLWPPPELSLVTERINAWAAWYSGNPDELEYAYSLGHYGLGYDSTSQARIYNHPAQYRGGVVGRLARWYWGEPVSVNQRRSKLHVPLASDISTASADMLFAEPPTITTPDDQKTQDRLDVLIDDGMQALFVEAADVGAGLGGVYLKVCWDRDLNPKGPWLVAEHADGAVPEWRWDSLSAVTFWRVLQSDEKKVVRHLERHESGFILNGVYEGTRETLGREVDLGGFTETADLERVMATGLTKLTAVYVANMKPNKLWRNIPNASPLGRADIAGCEPLLDALDETWSSWMRDIRNGKGRLVVPESMLESLGTGKGARWDAEREVWYGLNMLDPGSSGITINQFAIRVQEHKDTATEQIKAILRSSGYSAQTFGIQDSQGRMNAQTAKEVAAQERRSLITRDKKIKYWRPGLQDAIETLLMVDNQMFGSGVNPQRPEITFGETVQEDPSTVAQTAQLLRAAEAASTETLVAMVHPDWDDTQVQEEVTRIQAETAAQSVPGPADLGMGGPGMGGPGAGPGTPDPMANVNGY
jgi:A118 family predicted phage portal protein